ncbi:MAG TPA: hypothetical protein VNM87_14240, partial [Candidatus Udaeobacter sp.]|nr:hypothetical protein [Candidatus Udaeobacter sp.]
TGAPEKEPKQPKKEEPKEEPAPEAPKGPRVIAEATPEAPKPAPKAAAPKPAAQTETAKPAAPKVTPTAAVTTAATSETKAEEPAAVPAPKAVPVQYAVVMPGYPSKDSAEAEMKALELLGFRTKDAQIVKDPKRGGFMITFTRMKSKGSAEEVASNLQRMSFRALVEVAQK